MKAPLGFSHIQLGRKENYPCVSSTLLGRTGYQASSPSKPKTNQNYEYLYGFFTSNTVSTFLSSPSQSSFIGAVLPRLPSPLHLSLRSIVWDTNENKSPEKEGKNPLHKQWNYLIFRDSLIFFPNSHIIFFLCTQDQFYLQLKSIQGVHTRSKHVQQIQGRDGPI